MQPQNRVTKIRTCSKIQLHKLGTLSFKNISRMRMLSSSVTLNCQVTIIVMNSGSQHYDMSTISHNFTNHIFVLSLSQKLLEAESKYFNILMLGLDFSRNWPFWNIHLSDWPGINYFGPCQNYFYQPLLFDQAWTILVPFRAIFICLRFSKIVLEQNYVFHHHDIQSVNLLLTSDGHKSKKKTWLGENWQRYFFKSKLDGFRILIM